MSEWTEERKRTAAIFASQTRSLLFPDTRIVSREGWYQVVSPSAPRGVANEVAYSVLPEDCDVERIIDDTIATYAEHNQPAKWCIGPWSRPLDLGARLARRGFVASAVRGMGIATDRAFATPHDVTVEEVTLATLDVYLQTMARGWNITTTDVDRRVFAASIEESPPIARHFMAKVDGVPAATGALVDRGDHGYLLGTQVLAAFRGRGAYKAIVAARLGHLRTRGLEYAVTHAMEQTSAPILAHLGFETLFRSEVYVRA